MMNLKRYNIFHATDPAPAADLLAEFLDDHAVPKFFERVTVSPTTSGGGGWEVKAFWYDLPALTATFCHDSSNQSGGPMVTFKLLDGQGAGLSGAIVEGGTPNKIGNNGTLYHGYVCKSGISFTHKPDGAPFMTITKDNEGDTVIVCNQCNTSNGVPVLGVHVGAASGGKVNRLYVCSRKSGVTITHTPTVLSYGGQLTTLCPLPVSDTLTYTDGLFYTPLIQYASPGVYTIDGVQYLANGLWAVAD
jgi:hypothetical protein